MHSNIEASTTYQETLADHNERHWDRGSTIALTYGLFMIVFNIGLGIYLWSLPSDGWVIHADKGSPGYSVELWDEVIHIGTDLQPGDEVLAINGEPVRMLADKWHTFYTVTPPNFPDGTVLSYQIRRDGTPITVDVPIRRITAVEYLRTYWTNSTRSWPELLIAIAGPVSFFAIGLAVFLLRPGSRGAHALFLIGCGFIFNLIPTFPSLPSIYYPMLPSSVPFDTWTSIINPSLMYLALVFPRPKWLLRRYPRGGVILIYLPWLLIFNIVYLFNLHDRVGYYRATPILYATQIALMLVVVVGSLLHTALTERDPVSRSQFKWVALGLLSFAVVGVGSWLLGYLVGQSNSLLFRILQIVGQFGWFILPVTVAIAITRYRLFDIVVIIRRTTSYAIITGLLVVVYFGSIVILQRLLAPITGKSDVAVVLSTLLIAGLFLPIRRRVQDVIDRRFNRTRYDAEKTIEAFAATVRNETDLDALTAELLRVIQQTMEPATLSIWLRDQVEEGRDRQVTPEQVR